jgi:hypothetical protein
MSTTPTTPASAVAIVNAIAMFANGCTTRLPA